MFLNLMFGFSINWQKQISCKGFCDLVLKWESNEPFFKPIVIGDEKGLVYSNVTLKRLWKKAGDPPQRTHKADLHPQKSDVISIVGLERCYLVLTFCKQNHLFGGLMQLLQQKWPRHFSPWQCKATYCFDYSGEFHAAWVRGFASPSIFSRFSFLWFSCFIYIRIHWMGNSLILKKMWKVSWKYSSLVEPKFF